MIDGRLYRQGGAMNVRCKIARLAVLIISFIAFPAAGVLVAHVTINIPTRYNRPELITKQVIAPTGLIQYNASMDEEDDSGVS